MTEYFGADKKNFIFLGGSGSGKSEIALNLSAYLLKKGDRSVHFFDLDQTKPLFRARDVCRPLEEAGVHFHFEEQFFDAPTEVGGVREKLMDTASYTVLDVGGNEIGARLAGGFSAAMNRLDSIVWYVINPYRPWSRDLEAIDRTLTSILRASRVQSFHILCNPNLGITTTKEDFLQGITLARSLLDAYVPVELACVRAEIFHELHRDCGLPVFPINLYLAELFT